jgi:hypothetical protein
MSQVLNLEMRGFRCTLWIPLCDLVSGDNPREGQDRTIVRKGSTTVLANYVKEHGDRWR